MCPSSAPRQSIKLLGILVGMVLLCLAVIRFGLVSLASLGNLTTTTGGFKSRLALRQDEYYYRAKEDTDAWWLPEWASKEKNFPLEKHLMEEICSANDFDRLRSFAKTVDFPSCGKVTMVPVWEEQMAVMVEWTAEEDDDENCQEELSRENLSKRVLNYQTVYGKDVEMSLQPWIEVHRSKGADFDVALQCEPGQKRWGTALVVSQNFACKNIWHSLASLDGHWRSMKLLLAESDDAKVDAVVYNVTNAEELDAYMSHALLGAYVKQRISAAKAAPTNCFERVIFTDVPVQFEKTTYTGPLWPFSPRAQDVGWCINGNDKENVAKYPDFVPVFRQLQRDFLDSAWAPLPRPSFYEYQERLAKKETRLCYMYRHTAYKRRCFSPPLETEHEEMLKQWESRGKNGRRVVTKLAYDVGIRVTAAQQIRNMRQCDVLYGIHGAGLGHEFWREAPGLTVVEINESNDKQCQGYFRNLANVLGHRHVCTEDLPGFEKEFKDGVISKISLNVLEDLLESIAAEREGESTATKITSREE